MRKSSVNQALNKPRMSSGISNKAMAVIWGPVGLAAMMVGTEAGYRWSLVPVAVGVLAHAVLRWVFTKDARILMMYAKYSILATSYHPHSRETLPTSFERPPKVGRGVRI